ncbi:hypothetical protein Tco_0753824 [Tanacetum coccineum]
MRTRSQTRNHNRQQQSQPAIVQPFYLEEPLVNPPVVPMADNRTMAQLLQAPTEGYEDAILDTFYNASNANDQDSLNSAAGGNFLDKMPRECLRIIESKSKVRNSRNKAVVAKVSSNSSTPDISPDVAALTTEPPVYQAPTPQLQGVSKTDFENYVKANDVVLRNMQNQGQGLQNQMTNLTEMLSKFISSNTASSSNSGTLPSQTVTNPREHVNDITTRSGKTCEGPSTPLVPTTVVSTPLKEPEQDPETSMDKVQKPSSESTAQVPPPEDHDSIFIEIPKPKAKETVQKPTSPEPNSYQPKLPYPERMKVREKDKPSAQQSRFMKLFKQLCLEIGLKDALIEMPKFNKWLSTLLRNKEKLEEIAITTVNAECSAIILNKVPEKLKEKLTLRVGNDELVFYAEKYEKSKNKQFAHAISIIDFSKDEPFSGSTTNHSDALPPTSSPVKTSDNLKEFGDELTLLKKDMDEDVKNENSNVSNFDEPVLLNTPLTDKVECSDSEDDIDKIDAFLAMEVSSNFEEGYYDSEGDLIFLENLLSDDTTHNLDPEVISNHEPKQNESITFSPRSDHLHHEFVDDPLTLPSRNDHEFEEYLSLMTLLCEISTSRLQENVHANPSSIIASPIPVEDNEKPVMKDPIFYSISDDLI